MGGRGSSFHKGTDKSLNVTLKPSTLKINIQLFAAHKALKLPKKEYGKIIHELDSSYNSMYKGKRKIVHESGNFAYTVIVHDFNDYTIIKKERLK